MVFLQPQGPEVRDRAADEPGYGVGLLEGDGEGPGGGAARGAGGDEEDAGVLPGQGAPRDQDRVGHARVPPPPTRRAVPTSCGNEGNLDLHTPYILGSCCHKP